MITDQHPPIDVAAVRALYAIGRSLDFADDENDSVSALGALATVSEALDNLAAMQTVLVHDARRHGATWGALADRLGVSRQAAQQRYASPRAARPPQSDALDLGRDL